MLQLEGLKVDLGAFVLRADLSVAPGTRAAVVGPSGAGKSTLLSVVAGFLAPAEGRVLWDGRDLSGQEPGKRPLSIVFQDNNLFPHLSVADNVGLGLSPSLRLSKDDRARVAQSLERVGLHGMERRRPAELSGGQLSRVALARVLLRSRPLMLLDEPFAALGPAMRGEMLELVQDVAAETGATVLMVTHDPRDARRLGGQTILVAEGVARPPVATEALFADPPAVLRDYLGPD
ncbi:ATP-binding cassette domain-containing protein [Psychromarinibacter sp. C21-152]|uniref:ATP-binding cassette domain-containing protein n=1 Tax=Psychromarinibacter sediminicola TaxID=3033385 RepID=A0AAE3NN68_9RHOB|nr:ATP-binding cassette domain-containing protein [Psychromarinibacter sediminicola]MDF0599389.1 ATP-binding cassette domain-containing protein [Psychromarinibacter sediminicola]